ncbi:hypothetical protein U1Q18_047972 [Sarracenia purpurea var. burkii]
MIIVTSPWWILRKDIYVSGSPRGTKSAESHQARRSQSKGSVSANEVIFQGKSAVSAGRSNGTSAAIFDGRIGDD